MGSLRLNVALMILVCVGALYASVPHIQKTLFIAQPQKQVLAVPSSLVRVDSVFGRQLLDSSAHRADYTSLSAFFNAQVYLSYCGVATGVMVTNALTDKAASTQSNWFDHLPAGTRSSYQTFFGGMNLAEFEELLLARRFQAQRVHGGVLSLAEFRQRVMDNMRNPDDAFVINYHRAALEQKGGGHFSPIAAYHAPTDRVLILDVAAHKYPSVWASLESVWRALDTTDKGAGAQRGFVEVRRPDSL